MRTFLLTALLFCPCLALADDGGLDDGGIDDGGTPDAAISDDAGENTAPVARIAVTGSRGVCEAPCAELETDVNANVALSAAASSDPEGGSLSYIWELVSRPADSVAELMGEGAAEALFTPDREGIFDLALLVIDDGGNVTRSQVRVNAAIIPFQLLMKVLVDGTEVTCTPICTVDAVRIASDVEIDASGSTHDPTHGELKFSWVLTVPPGSSATLRVIPNTSDQRVNLQPDVDGPYEIRVRMEDSRRDETRSVGFNIPHALWWKPFECGCTTSNAGGPQGALAMLLAAWVLRRISRRSR